MFQIKNFQPREYQKNILETTTRNNTLVVIPTGLGKTKIAILLAIERLNKFPNSKIIVLTPTKPLSSQIQQEFIDSTNIPAEKISLLTGQIKPEIRKEIFNESIIIIATPQTIQFDLENNRISLQDASLLVIDECHRSRQNFANTKVSQFYQQQSKNQRILALTASPGSTLKRINEIKQNLNLTATEIRTEEDSDVMPYIQQKDKEHIYVSLPEEIKQIKTLLQTVYKQKLKNLKSIGLTKPTKLINKKDLLQFQKYLQYELQQGNKSSFYGLSLIAQAIKLEHAMTLLETQGINPLNMYLQKLKTDPSKAAKIILTESKIQKASQMISHLHKNKFIHPKQQKLKEIIQEELQKNPNSKIIIFANYRFTVNELVSFLKEIKNAKPTKLVGQKEGLTQKQQSQIINDFENNIYNILVCTSIGEEGIHLGSANLAIFYEPIPSEIRSIQRKGRVARIKIGKITYLITKDTKDEAFYWSSYHKEKQMKRILHGMQEKEKQTKL